jgi:transcriptional regulator with XRE-family HTH domain
MMHIKDLTLQMRAGTMEHWTKSYVFAVLEQMQWSMNKLATEIGVSASTINRPIRAEGLSAKTVSKIYNVTKVDPEPYFPKGFSEPPSLFKDPFQIPPRRAPADIRREQLVMRGQEITSETPDLAAQYTDISMRGHLVQIHAVCDKAGLSRLIEKLTITLDILDDA